ncbi:MAG: SRPBCC family protein [Candidatus Nanopelagicales bacterium]
MGTTSVSEKITVNAPFATVLAAVRDTASQPQWFPGMISAEVLEADDEGRTLRAHQVNDVKIAKDEFDLAFVHTDTGVSWELEAPSKAQKSASGSWQLVDKGGSTDVTLSLAIDSSLPLPGFVLKKTLGDTAKGACKGLKKWCE